MAWSVQLLGRNPNRKSLRMFFLERNEYKRFVAHFQSVVRNMVKGILVDNSEINVDHLS